ncbi:MAG TPA: PilZ domain-containing protein [Kofleriaceae bacterium]|nr:PilZ domain-containing protein [Kofleriaceae bacterium]
MQHLFELVFEYRNLLVRRKTEGPGLDVPAKTRLGALHRLLGREPFPDHGPSGSGAFSRRRHARCEVELSASMHIGTTVTIVELLNLGAGGVCAIIPEPLPIGERGVLRMTSPESGRIYECTMQVSWVSDEGGQLTAGMRFIGAPSEVQPAS